jgi:hypothetical protein
MANAFELHWGCGKPGTVATEYQTEAPNRQPRGISLITLLTSLLDPRFKIGPGLSQVDKDYLWSCREEVDQQDHPGHNEDSFHNMFDDLNALRMAEGFRVGDAAPAREPDEDSH